MPEIFCQGYVTLYKATRYLYWIFKPKGCPSSTVVELARHKGSMCVIELQDEELGTWRGHGSVTVWKHGKTYLVIVKIAMGDFDALKSYMRRLVTARIIV